MLLNNIVNDTKPTLMNVLLTNFKFFIDMIKEREYCSKVIETEFNKPVAVTKKDDEDFKSFTKCWIYKKTCEEGEVKVKDRDHITEKYRRSTYQEYNLNLSPSKKICAVFYNSQNYDLHLIFQEVGKNDLKIKIYIWALLLRNLKRKTLSQDFY